MHADPSGPPSLRVERTDDILRVELDRPRRANALDRGLVDGFLATLEEPRNVAGLRALVVTGSGENFCGGFDLSDLATQDESELVVRFLKIETLLQRLYHAPFLTIACASGNAIGAGADIVGACGYRIADPGTSFRMPGWQFGIALGTRRLADRIGAAAARNVLSASHTFSASEAFELGFVTHVAERAGWPALVDSIVDSTRSLTILKLGELFRLSVPDHREADMAALVESALYPPGLKQRILEYTLARRSTAVR